MEGYAPQDSSVNGRISINPEVLSPRKDLSRIKSKSAKQRRASSFLIPKFNSSDQNLTLQIRSENAIIMGGTVGRLTELLTDISFAGKFPILLIFPEIIFNF